MRPERPELPKDDQPPENFPVDDRSDVDQLLDLGNQLIYRAINLQHPWAKGTALRKAADIFDFADDFRGRLAAEDAIRKEAGE